MAERIKQYLDEVGAQVRWKRVRPALTQELQRLVPRYGHEPGHGLALGAVLCRGLVGLDIGLLHRVLRVLWVLQEKERKSVERGVGPLIDLGQCPGVPAAHLRDTPVDMFRIRRR